MFREDPVEIQGPFSKPIYCFAQNILTVHSDNAILKQIGIDWSLFELFAIERQEKIKNLLEQNGRVAITELVALFDTSHETVRKDLVYLEQQNVLKRIYGGAVRTEPFCDLQSLALRRTERVEQKIELCRYAAELIQEKDMIAIDEGSTSVELARILAARFQMLTVLTHNLEVFRILSENSPFEVFLCGGKFVREENAFSGHFAGLIASQMHTQKAFLCPASVSARFGVTDYGEAFIPIQKGYAANTDKVIVLADSLKLETCSSYKICDMTPDITLVTDSRIDPDILQMYRGTGIDIVCKQP